VRGELAHLRGHHRHLRAEGRELRHLDRVLQPELRGRKVRRFGVHLRPASMHDERHLLQRNLHRRQMRSSHHGLPLFRQHVYDRR
jgi:hypothetical protein